MSDAPFAPQFEAYFKREVAQKAARSLRDGAEIEFRVDQEVFVFGRTGGQNQLSEGAAAHPQVVFTMNPAAATQILSDPTDEIGAIGVSIAKMIARPQGDARVQIKVQAGVFELARRGYFGVVAGGGGAFAKYLASIGFGGIKAIKQAIQKLRAG